MKTSHRSYLEAAGDFNRLCHFTVTNERYLRTHSAWCLGRLVDWKFGLYENKRAFPNFCEQNAQIWFDGFGEVAGFAISEEGGAEVAILLADGFLFLFEEMLAWAQENWGPRGAQLSIEISEKEIREAQILEGAGFRAVGAFSTRRFDLTQDLPPRPRLEAGFTIVDMAAHPDYRAQRILRDNAFGGRNDVSEEILQQELLFYHHIHHGPIYHAPADLCVMAPDGRFVAGCEALIDARNASADIERICTHSDFRRRGFARAVIRACMERLQQMGLRTAYITGYSPEALALYSSLGHVEELGRLIYTRQGERVSG